MEVWQCSELYEQGAPGAGDVGRIARDASPVEDIADVDKAVDLLLSRIHLDAVGQVVDRAQQKIWWGNVLGEPIKP